jgi:hypothetical protein
MEENVATSPESRPTVRGVGVKYGLYAAGLGVFQFLVLVLIGANAFDNKWSWIGIIFTIALIVLAHREFKREGDGFMSYGQGVGIGFWMSLVSVLITGVFTFVYISFIEPGVMERFFDAQRIQMEDNNMPDEQIDMAITWTQNLFWPMYFFMGTFFGVLIAVIISIFTQKKNPQPAF